MAEERHSTASTLIIACGALAKEVLHILEQSGTDHIDLKCLPAKLHNTPQFIAERLQEEIRNAKNSYQNIKVLYGDCGTGGEIDRVLKEEQVERIFGAHCYEFFSGSTRFNELSEIEPGTFYLTDFLVRHFETLVWKGLGLEEHPELLHIYFGNYKKLVYLRQLHDPELDRMAEEAASRLELEFSVEDTGLGFVEEFILKDAS